MNLSFVLFLLFAGVVGGFCIVAIFAGLRIARLENRFDGLEYKSMMLCNAVENHLTSCNDATRVSLRGWLQVVRAEIGLSGSFTVMKYNIAQKQDSEVPDRANDSIED